MSILLELSWQHQALVVETILSCIIACWLITRGWYQKSWKTGVGFTVWNLVVAYLLVAGADQWVWQYTFYALYLALDEYSVIRGAMQGTKAEIPEGKENSYQFTTIVWMMVVLALIGTGATA